MPVDTTQLSAAKRALLAQRLRGDRTPRTTIPQRPSKTSAPLSFSQQRLWFLTQLEPDHPFYNIPTALRLEGELNISALQGALNQLVDRHEILRTTFDTIDEQPQQTIHSQMPLPIGQVNLSALSATAQEQAVEQLAVSEGAQAFNLSQGPLLRITLIQLSATESVLLLTLHHIISDAWSMGIFVRELATLYTAAIQSQPLSLAKLPIQYADFAHWQRHQTDRLAPQLRYWQEQFAILPPVLALPTDHPRPAQQTYRGDRCTIELPETLTQALNHLAQETDCTLFMVLLASFQTLLHRYTHQSDLTVGTPIANRNQIEIEGLIGFFINTLALRADLSGHPTFRQLLAQVRKRTIGAYEHQDVSFEKLVDELEVPRDLSHSPLFQVMLIVQNAPTASLQVPGLTLTPLNYETQTTKFDLTLICIEQERHLTTVMEFNTDLYEPATIQRMLSHWQTLLLGLTQNPQTPIGFLPLLEPGTQTLPKSWNQPQVDIPQSLVHQRFEWQVQQSPDAIALTYEHQSLTYQALNQQANQLAHYLQSQRVGPEVYVGICLERSPDLLVALLAVFKAGGTYIPLDPSYPSERLAFMVKDSGLQLLLTQTHLQDRPFQIPCLCLDQDQHLWATASDLDPISDVTSAHLAYVIYTSGSTGQPKGVQITHQSLVNFLHAHQQSPGISAEDRLLAVTSVSFDIAVLELFLPLMVGAEVIMVPTAITSDGYQLAQAVSTATIMQATPATWRVLLTTGWAGQSTLKLLCGGEALAPDLVEQLLPRCDSLWNMYGPTETTIWSTHAQITSHTPITIGQPIANTEVYLLDPYLNPVPMGVPGELYLGGAGLARGYLHHPSLTAEKFIPHPFSSRAGARLYRTGDLARYQPDGTLQHLGRRDHQVKVRGFRIELHEIEAHLNQHPHIQAAVVTVKGQGKDQLVAYYVPDNAVSLPPADIRQTLQQTLPTFMVPTLFVSLPALPLTPNGKIDRNALPDPLERLMPLGTPYIGPRTPTEQRLTAIWTQVLDIPEIGIDDNFFALGGDSIRSLQVVSRARQTHLSLVPKDIFQYQTIRSLASAVEATEASVYEDLNLTAQLPQIQQDTLHQQLGPHRQIADVYPLSPMQQGMLFHTLYSPQAGLYVAQFCYRLQGPLHSPFLQQAWQQVIAQHPMLRTAFCWEGLETPMQWVEADVHLPWMEMDWRDDSEPEQCDRLDDFLHQDRIQGFSLHYPPLMRFTLIQVSEFEFEFIWSFHHLILDGWSLPLVLQSVFRQYAALENGQDLSALAPRPYRDYIAWLHHQPVDIAMTFWQQYLQGFAAPNTLEASTMNPNGQAGSRADRYQGYTRLSHNFPKSPTSALQAQGQKHHLTLSTLAQGAWAIVLCHLSQSEDVVFGATTSGRPPQLREAEQMVGVFINTLPIRVQITPDTSLMSWLQALQEQQITARQFEYTSLTQIQQASEVPQGTPLFESLLVFENYPVDSTSLQGLQTSVQIKDFRSFVNNSYPLTVRVLPGATLKLEMMADLVRVPTHQIQRWLQLFAHTLQAIATAPERSLGELLTTVSLQAQALEKQHKQVLKAASFNKLKHTKRKAVASENKEVSS